MRALDAAEHGQSDLVLVLVVLFDRSHANLCACECKFSGAARQRDSICAQTRNCLGINSESMYHAGRDTLAGAEKRRDSDRISLVSTHPALDLFDGVAGREVLAGSSQPSSERIVHTVGPIDDSDAAAELRRGLEGRQGILQQRDWGRHGAGVSGLLAYG